MKKQLLSMAVVGCGNWGPNLVRNFMNIPGCNMALCCDLDNEKLKRMQTLYPTIQTTTHFEDVLNGDIQAVGIATPLETHYSLAKACLETGKHVLLETPMTATSEQAEKLITLAERHRKTLMVSHVFEYNASVDKIREIVTSGELGDIIYVHSTRTKLRKNIENINVIWDLAPHDLSIILYVLGKIPTSVNARGLAYKNKHTVDVAMITLQFEDALAFVQNSWLDPHKTRKIVFVGSKKTLVFDDINKSEKIKIYDQLVDAPAYYDSYAEFHFAHRYGDIYIPSVNEYEPLRCECTHFIDCIRQNKTPKSDGTSGLRIIEILEAANHSLAQNGANIPIKLAN